MINPSTTVGLDVGITNFVVTSDGRKFEPNRKLRDSLQRLKALQKRASKKVKGSNNRIKAKKCIAKLHEKISSRRLDYIHQVTTRLIRDKQTDTIVIEGLNVEGLLRNRKLAQAISDVSFGKLFEVLKYKCDWYGKNLIIIDRFDPSSKRCNHCGHIHTELTLKDREWTCAICKTDHDRDENAAKNICWYGLEQTKLKKQITGRHLGRACGVAAVTSDKEAGNISVSTGRIAKV